VLKTRIGRFCALSLPYDKQFEKELVTKKLKIKDVRFPSSEEVQKLVGCEIGYVPPFGQIAHLSLYFDRDLLRETHLFFTPGIAGKFFKFNSIDLRNLYNPMLV
jgi:prolyl-tRNA editing enzyme YbaK/EbsC (Cys-tRNA(Pro) deacylase)